MFPTLMVHMAEMRENRKIPENHRHHHHYRRGLIHLASQLVRSTGPAHFLNSKILNAKST